MKTGCGLRRSAAFAALVLPGLVMTGCGGSADPRPPPPQQAPSPPIAAGSGNLTVSVADPDGRPLAQALVSVFNPSQSATVGSASTGSNGLATIDSVPAAVIVSINHEFGQYYRNANVDVAQVGGTFLRVTLLPRRPRPTVALLPVEIEPGSLNADRSELTLRVAVVASASTPLVPASYGSAGSTPSLALAVGDTVTDSRRQCFVWLDLLRTAPSCGTPWGESPYTVSVEQFSYDPAGAVPVPVAQASVQSAMLVIDQSRRVSTLDPGAFRSFAARRFIERNLISSTPTNLSLTGLAGAGGDLATPVSLPEPPLWSPLGGGAIFSTDRVVLESGVTILEPLVGGGSPVFEALKLAAAVTAANAPPGDRAVVALLGGGDDGAMSESQRNDALASLRQQRDDTGVRFIVVAAAPPDLRVEQQALAELAAALRAPKISLGVTQNLSDHLGQTWTSGSYAALDLAADLIDGLPLPTLSAAFRVTGNGAGAFPAGATVRGVVYVESDICPMGCWEHALEFAVVVP